MTKTVRALVLSSAAVLAQVELGEAQPYTFTTITGTAGALGTNDGVNQSAQFNFPAGIAVDNTGHVFVADLLNHTIRELTLSGTNWTSVTLAGLGGVPGYRDGTNSDALFYLPAGIAVGPNGDLFVTERRNHTIRKVSPSGTNWVVTTIAGLAGVIGSNDGTNSGATFHLPSGIAVDNSNHLYVADTANSVIREITPIGPDWVVSTIAGSVTNAGLQDGSNAAAAFDYPYGITLSPSGIFYIADWGNNAIRALRSSAGNWVVETIAGFSGSSGATDGPAGMASFYSPAAVAADSAGSLYVTDQSNSTIRKLTLGPSGWTVSTLGGRAMSPGSADGVSTNALFKKPWGIATEASGKLFIADYGNSTLRQGLAIASSAPVLQISFVAGQVVLSWPAWASNYVPEAVTTLGAGMMWTTLTNGSAVGPTFFLTNSAGGAQGFFRLKK